MFAVATAANLTWAPAYSLVSGDLPPDAASRFRSREGTPTGAVRFQVEVLEPGTLPRTVHKAKRVIHD